MRMRARGGVGAVRRGRKEEDIARRVAAARAQVAVLRWLLGDAAAGAACAQDPGLRPSPPALSSARRGAGGRRALRGASARPRSSGPLPPAFPCLPARLALCASDTLLSGAASGCPGAGSRPVLVCEEPWRVKPLVGPSCVSPSLQ